MGKNRERGRERGGRGEIMLQGYKVTTPSKTKVSLIETSSNESQRFLETH
jgi:hypothetical protein